jgi:heme o synthase
VFFGLTDREEGVMMNNHRVMNTSEIGHSPKEHLEATKGSLWKDFLALIKIGIINSNLMMTFSGFWLALFYTKTPFLDHWKTLTLVLIGTAFVIAGGCVLNNYYDRDIDQHMKRTKRRPTVTGTMSRKLILYIGLIFSLTGFVLLFFINIYAAISGIFGWFVYVVLYTMWSKRRYTLNTIVGSFSGAAPPLIGWFAVEPQFHYAPLVIFLIMFIWQTPHFLALAMLKVKEYKKVKIPMLPVVYGFPITKRQITVYITCLLPLPFFLPELGNVFLVIATLLNVGWLILAIRGFFTNDDTKWAKQIFVYSLNYLTIITLTIVFTTLPALLSL